MSAKVKPFYKKSTLKIEGKLLDLSIPRIMGILNVTPDSFYDGGKYTQVENLLLRAEEMVSEGADILDIGGYSSRPGAKDITVEEEIDRVCQAVEQVIQHLPQAIISVDTFRADVAKSALKEGAKLINDISGGELDPEMLSFVASSKTPYILMHMRGNPRTMSKLTDYKDLILEMTDYFLKKIKFLNENGGAEIVIDPGFGFSKTMDQNYELLKNLNYFEVLGVPILVGISRKSMFYKLLGTTPEESLNATTAAHMVALNNGASILRVHDVKEALEAVKIFRLTEK